MNLANTGFLLFTCTASNCLPQGPSVSSGITRVASLFTEGREHLYDDIKYKTCLQKEKHNKLAYSRFGGIPLWGFLKYILKSKDCDRMWKVVSVKTAFLCSKTFSRAHWVPSLPFTIDLHTYKKWLEGGGSSLKCRVCGIWGNSFVSFFAFILSFLTSSSQRRMYGRMKRKDLVFWCLHC